MFGNRVTKAQRQHSTLLLYFLESVVVAPRAAIAKGRGERKGREGKRGGGEGLGSEYLIVSDHVFICSVAHPRGLQRHPVSFF